MPTTVAAFPATLPVRSPKSRLRANWRRIVQTLLLVVLPFACYWPALNGAFVWDDDLLITRYPVVRASDGLRYIWFSTVPYDYFPLANTASWVQWRLWGEHPLGYHLVNLALHVASSFLLWRLLRVLRVPGAWFGAVLFAVHPINVASVAWIAECKTLMAMAFSLGSLLCYVRSGDRATRSGGWYAASLLLHVLALLSKPSVVMLPCVLLVLAWWRTGRVQWRDLGRAVPFFVVSLASGLATIWFQYHRAVSAENLAHANPLPVRLIVAGRTLSFYLGKLFWPRPLAMIYPRWEFPADDLAGFLWPAGVAALLVAVWWGKRWWGRAPAAALASFVLILLPVSGLLHMSFFSYSYVSDHLVYAAVPGVLALVAALLTGFYEKGGSTGRAALIAMSGLVGSLGLCCAQRADDFSGPEKLWRSTLAINPHSPVAHNNLGLALQQRRAHEPAQLRLAEAHFREALKADGQLAGAGINLANVLRAEGRWAESAATYRQVLAASPDAESFNNYGVALLEMGDNTDAKGAFRQAVKLRPSSGSAYYNLYGIALAENHLPEACALLRTCLQIDPDNVQALTALLSLQLERPDQPAIPPLAAGTTLAIAERACALTRYQGARQLLLCSKAALAADRHGEAAEFARQAHAAATAQGDVALAGAIEEFQRSLPP